MKTRIYMAAVLSAIILPLATKAAVDLSELLNPDDVMLRKPAQKVDAQKVAEAQKKAETESAARADIERRSQEAKAKLEAEKKAKAEAERLAAEKAAAEKAEARRKADEAAAKAETERRAAEAQAKAEAERLAAERASAEKAKAEAEKKAKEDVARQAAAKAEAERKMAEAERLAAEKAAADAELKRLREQVAAERAARERAEAEKAAAETKAAEERQAAERAAEKAARAEKRAAYLANPDPDERSTPKKKLEVTGDAKDVTEASAADVPAAVVKKAGAKKPKKELTGRSAVITADRTDYDRKEGVILFDRNVYVDDEQYQMHADRLFVFLDGTNDMKRLVALGNVSLTNEDKTAWCQKAVYTKTSSQIVLFGDEQNPAWLRDAGGRKGDESEVSGLRITYWIDSGLATVEKSVIKLPGFGGSKNPKDLFNPGSDKKKKKNNE